MLTAGGPRGYLNNDTGNEGLHPSHFGRALNALNSLFAKIETFHIWKFGCVTAFCDDADYCGDACDSSQCKTAVEADRCPFYDPKMAACRMYKRWKIPGGNRPIPIVEMPECALVQAAHDHLRELNREDRIP
jgi:hypothetical protein